jgi:3-oxoadipate enol-lactonase
MGCRPGGRTGLGSLGDTMRIAEDEQAPFTSNGRSRCERSQPRGTVAARASAAENEDSETSKQGSAARLASAVAVDAHSTGMTRATVNGIELYYEVEGTGPALLLIPGLGADTRLFGGIIRPLASNCQVVTFDPRGAGRSDKPPGPYSIEQMADDAAGLLDVLGIEQAVVAGYSMGGRIALSLALDHSSRVRRLVLAATSASTPPSRKLSRRWLALEVLSRLPMPADKQPRWAWECQRRASAAFDATARLSEIAVPTLILHARRDHLTPLTLARALHAAIAGAALVEVPGGHISLVTRKRHRFAEELSAFMAG